MIIFDIFLCDFVLLSENFEFQKMTFKQYFEIVNNFMKSQGHKSCRTHQDI